MKMYLFWDVEESSPSRAVSMSKWSNESSTGPLLCINRKISICMVEKSGDVAKTKTGYWEEKNINSNHVLIISCT